MPTLHVRNVPEALHRQLVARAQGHHRSLNAEVIDLLQQAVGRDSRTPGQILAAMEERNRFTPKAVGAPDSTALLREDRDR